MKRFLDPHENGLVTEAAIDNFGSWLQDARITDRFWEMSCFHGMIPREDVDEMMTRDAYKPGTFLIRTSRLPLSICICNLVATKTEKTLYGEKYPQFKQKATSAGQDGHVIIHNVITWSDIHHMWLANVNGQSRNWKTLDEILKEYSSFFKYPISVSEREDAI